MSLPICRTCGKLRVTSTTPPMPLCECEAVPVTAGANDKRALASALRAALDDPARYEWGEGPWEHLGDAERDVRQLLDDLDALAARVEELEAENARLEARLRTAQAERDALAEQVAYAWGWPNGHDVLVRLRGDRTTMLLTFCEAATRAALRAAEDPSGE